MVKSLNSLYAHPGKVFFHCNEMGSINISKDVFFRDSDPKWIDTANSAISYCNGINEDNVPGRYHSYVGEEEEMPSPARALYNKYFEPRWPYRTYVVSIGRTYGMAYTMLFHYDWLRDEGLDVDEDERVLDALHEAVWAQAEQMQKASEIDLQLYVGSGTDPDGDELMLFVPANRLAPTMELQIDDVDKIFGTTDPEKDIYEEVLNFIQTKLAADQNPHAEMPMSYIKITNAMTAVARFLDHPDSTVEACDDYGDCKWDRYDRSRRITIPAPKTYEFVDVEIKKDGVTMVVLKVTHNGFDKYAKLFVRDGNPVTPF